MKTPARVIVLGIDAADPALLERWAGDGTLPTLGSLLERGLVMPIRGLDGFFVGSTWPSLATGVSPARHGVHYLAQVPPGECAYRRVAEGDYVKREPFWTHLSREGRRVAILDVPLSRLTPGLNGVQTVEWGGHDAVFGFQAWPEALGRELLATYGTHPLGSSCDGERRSAVDYRLLVEQLVTGARTKGRLTSDLLRRGGWDLFMQVFTEAHCAGHQCWHLHDPAHPNHDRAVVEELGDPLRAVYAAIDSAVAGVLDEAPEALVVVLAAHGMSYSFGAQFLLPQLLIRLGAATPPRAAMGVSARATDAARGLARRLPAPVRRPLASLRGLLRTPGSEQLPTLGVDPATSACLPIANGLAVGGIRLNLVGREPTGVLEPGDTAETFARQLAADLLDIVDDRTGRPAIRRVLRTADLYRGEHLGDLPELLVEWNDEEATGSAARGNGAGACVRLSSPKLGIVEGVNRWGRTGEHRPGGLLVAAGPTVRAGRSQDGIGLLDIAPTLTRLLGVELPDCDGAPSLELAPPTP